MSKSSNSRDAKLAWEIHNQLNSFDITGVTENAILPKNDSKENYRPKTLIDNTLEVIDPTPNIHTLFMQFDKRFFLNKLLSVEVKWSHRMTSCAGTCSFNTGSRYCVIALSSPLLKLRPRKDLVETLLHEMIHAFLFVTNNNRDRDGHGPEFCKHMHRINKEAGTNITIYHTFHEEVKLYQQHWWRCNGPCQKKHPFFGMVRRAMNRAPGPNDFWWKEHQLTCGGQFIKVREPEKPQTKSKKTKNDPKNTSIEKWVIPSPDNRSKGKADPNIFRKPGNKTKAVPKKNTGSNNSFKTGGVGLKTKGGSSVLTVNKWNANANSNEPGVTKLGNATNNVHGFGTGGPDSAKPSSSSSKTASSGNHVSFSGTLGGSATGKSRLLNLFNSPKSLPSGDKSENKRSESKGLTVKCPICKNLILEKISNVHIDKCLVSKKKKPEHPFNNSTPMFNPGKSNSGKTINEKDMQKCPVCSKSFPAFLIGDHIDLCLSINIDENSSTSGKFESPKSSPVQVIVNDDSSDADTPTKKRKIPDFFNVKEPKKSKNDDEKANCPVCGKVVQLADMNNHLDYCLSTIDTEINTNEAGPSTKNTERNPKIKSEKESKPETCMICNQILNPEIPLSQHLDDCLRNMFNDDSLLDDDPVEFIKIKEEPKATSSKKNGETIVIDDSFSEKKIKVKKEPKVTSSKKLVETIVIDDSFSEENDEVDERETNNRFPCPICMSFVPIEDLHDHVDSCR